MAVRLIVKLPDTMSLELAESTARSIQETHGHPATVEPLISTVEDLVALDQVLALARVAAGGVLVPGSDASIRHVEGMRERIRSQLR
jgi:hypothetical protein